MLLGRRFENGKGKPVGLRNRFLTGWRRGGSLHGPSYRISSWGVEWVKYVERKPIHRRTLRSGRATEYSAPVGSASYRELLEKHSVMLHFKAIAPNVSCGGAKRVTNVLPRAIESADPCGLPCVDRLVDTDGERGNIGWLRRSL